MKNVRFGIKERLLAAVATVMVLCASLAVGFSMQTGVVARAESDSAIKSVSLTLNENISMNYFVNIPADAADDPAPSMQFTMNTAEEDYTATVTDYETVNGQWKFTYDGVTPQHMCDEVTAVLSYMTDGGSRDSSNTRTTTLEGVLEKYTEATAAEMNISDAAYEKLQTLVADIAAYGAASQAYLGYEGNGTPVVGTPGEFTGEGLGSDLDLPETLSARGFGLTIRSASKCASPRAALRRINSPCRRPSAAERKRLPLPHPKAGNITMPACPSPCSNLPRPFPSK